MSKNVGTGKMLTLTAEGGGMLRDRKNKEKQVKGKRGGRRGHFRKLGLSLEPEMLKSSLKK